MSGQTLPLVDRHGPGATMVWREGRPVSRETFLADVFALAERLPEQRYVLNLCEDRYHFMLAFAAALVRGQTSLLPPNRSEAVLREIASEHAGTYILYDQEEMYADIPSVRVRGRAGRNGRVDIPQIPAGQLAALVFTSGSTGKSQGNAKTWGSMVCTTRMLGQRLFESLDVPPNVVATVPPQHMYGMETSVLLCLQGGTAVHGGRPFYPADVAAAVAAIPAPRVLVTTPIHLRACVQAGVALPALTFILSATAPLAPELAGEVESRYCAPLLEIYGCTETASIASRRTLEGEAWLPYEGIELTVRDGVATVRGPQLAEPVTLQDFIEPLGHDRFALRGRGEDMLNIAGKRASLADLNLKLQQIDGVMDGVIFQPEPNGQAVDRLAALVVAPGLTGDQILTALRQSVDPVFLPRPLYVVERLPRNETSKLPRDALLAFLREQETLRS